MGQYLKDPKTGAVSYFEDYQVPIVTKQRGYVPVTNTGVVGPNTTSSNSKTSTGSTSYTSARDKRLQEMDNFTGWDNNEEVRRYQEAWWKIYVETGNKNTSEQKRLNEMAQEARLAGNPMYDVTKLPWGPGNKGQADRIFLPDNFPTTNFMEGNFAGIAVIGILGLALVSFLKG